MTLLDDRPRSFADALDELVDEWLDDEPEADLIEALARKIRELETDSEAP